MRISRKLVALAATALISLAAAAPALAYHYPPVVRGSFIHSCLENGAPQTNCTCAINYIQARESLRTFEVQVLRYENGGPVPGIMRQAARHCGLSITV